MMNESIINLILLSDRRKDLLFLLKEGPRDIDIIKEMLRVDASTIQPHIKKMKYIGLINEKNKVYSLSEIGKIIAENLQPFLNTVGFFEENAEYWKSHDLDSIPEFLLERIDELEHSEVLEPDASRLGETPKTLLENMLKSKKIVTFTSYFHPEAPSIYLELVENGAEVTLCVTQKVAERLFSRSREETLELIRAEKSKFLILRKPAAIPSVIVTDCFLAFKLLETDGKFRDQLVFCSGEKALIWGKELFQYCAEGAKPLDEEGFLRIMELEY
jgi:predicted transcriptional regulator